MAGQRAGRLSGGEQQRLSIAVAMAGSPQLLLADEPTSQLDVHNRDLVVDLLAYVTERFGTTVVVVTHDPVVADAMHRRITLAEGRVVVPAGTRAAMSGPTADSTRPRPGHPMSSGRHRVPDVPRGTTSGPTHGPTPSTSPSAPSTCPLTRSSSTR